MTQDDQETLNEIFLGKEDPDMAFKKPMTNNLKEIPDLYNYLEDRLLRYIGGGDSLFGEEIHNLLQGLENDIQALINQKEKEARLDELKNLMAQHSRTFTQKVTDSSGAEYVNESYLFISKYEAQERVEQLKEELNKKGK